MARRAAALVAAAVLLAVSGCGEDEPEDGGGAPAAQSGVRLEVVFDEDGEGGSEPVTSRLTCPDGGEGEATGPLAERGTPAELCAAARELAGFLAETPPRDRICTQVYGGPQTARIAGSIDGREVERRFARNNGCEISYWDRAVPLLPRTRGAATPAPAP